MLPRAYLFVAYALWDTMRRLQLIKNTTLQRGLIFFFVCLIFMLICSGFTSPLYPHYTGLDSSVFLTVAKGIVNGRIAYIDLFDHKGPVFYWMEAVGYYIGGRTGVFVFQCLLLTCDLLVIDRISSLFHVDFLSLAIPFFAVFFYLFQHGNLTEEFSLPMLYAGIYYELRFLLSEDEEHAPGIAYFYGILLGLLAFIRLNNAFVLCALLLCIIIVLIWKRQWVNLLGNLCAGILGLATVAVPICFYYYRHGALYDMLYGTFLFNLVYAKNNTHIPIFSSRFFYFLILFAPGEYASGVFWMKWRETKHRAYSSLLFTAIMTFIMLAYTNVYLHYYMLGLPLFVVAVAAMRTDRPFITSRKREATLFFWKHHTKDQELKNTAIVLACITVIYALLSAYSACAPIYKTYLTDIAYNEYAQIKTGISIIPEEERESVIAYNALANYYYHAEILPCYKYFTLQKWLTTEKVNVYQEFMKYLIDEHPLWVIIRAGEDDQLIRSILKNGYTCKSTDSCYEYYRYIGNAGK